MTPGTLILAILALGVLIIVHEGGHFLIARLSGMRVDRFSIGFGPTLLSFKRGETIYQIALIPLGGFVQIAGLQPGEDGERTVVEKDGKFVEVDRVGDPRMYNNRPAWQRFATIFAGPGTNYIFAALMMVFIYLMWGVPVEGKSPIVGDLKEGKPAAAAGLERGDEIVAINHSKITDTAQVAPAIAGSQGQPVTMEILRDGQPKTIMVKPEKDGNDYRIGIEIWTKDESAPAAAGECIKQGLMFPVRYSGFILRGFREIFAGRQKAEFSGPWGIVKVMRRQIAQGAKNALTILAIISVYLGLFNLLPLPALDGGRLAFLSWELISRRRVNQRVEQTIHLVGMVVLLAFLVYVTAFNDLGLKQILKK